MKIGVSGLGRIGRTLVRRLLAQRLHVAAIWDPFSPLDQLPALLKYDSIHGHLEASVEYHRESKTLYLDGMPCAASDSKVFPVDFWSEHGVDILVECSGRDKHVADLRRNFPGSLRHVFVTWLHPEVDKTIVMGANHAEFRPGAHRLISVGTCTGNCFLPLLKVLSDHFSVERGNIAVLHPYLSGQNVLDNPAVNGRWSFTRAAPLSVIPADTRLIQSIREVFPLFADRFHALCYRVPTPAVLTLDVNMYFSHPIAPEALQNTLEDAAENSHKNILTTVDEPFASIDFKDTSWSAAVYSYQPGTAPSNYYRFIVWQDNEWGYCRCITDMITRAAGPGGG